MPPQTLLLHLPHYFPSIPISDNTHQLVLWQHKQCQHKLIDLLWRTHSRISNTEAKRRHNHHLGKILSVQCLGNYIKWHSKHMYSFITCTMACWQTDTSCKSISFHISFHLIYFSCPVLSSGVLNLCSLRMNQGRVAPIQAPCGFKLERIRPW